MRRTRLVITFLKTANAVNLTGVGMPERVGLSLMNQIVTRQRQKAEGATAIAEAIKRVAQGSLKITVAASGS